MVGSIGAGVGIHEGARPGCGRSSWETVSALRSRSIWRGSAKSEGGTWSMGALGYDEGDAEGACGGRLEKKSL